MIFNLMHLVQGIPSPKYKFNATEERFSACSFGPNSSANSLVGNSLSASWIHCGTIFRRLERGLVHFSDERNGGKIFAAFSSAILSYLATHRAYASSLSTQVTASQKLTKKDINTKTGEALC